jgi:pantoate--beta-alanine ligase
VNDRRIATTPDEVRASLANGQAIGLVPTMGALHAGHISLIERSAAENDQTVVSIFVNPSLFDDWDDLASYPRNLATDSDMAFRAGASVIYAPPVSAVYPDGFATTVAVAGPSLRWEGESRPGHFAGVTTVVSILLNTVLPTRSYFGEKDFQQLAVIRRMHSDLRLPGSIVGCPTVRDSDGLALSSRNARLTPELRRAAAAIPRALYAIRDLARGGQSGSEELIRSGSAILSAEPKLALKYLAIVDETTLEPVAEANPSARALIAVHAGETRLIDNLSLA